MIWEGLVKLVNNGLSSPPSTIGGFFVELPKDQTLPSWSYRLISDHGEYGLVGEHGFVMARTQIDCYGNTAVEVLDLSRSINAILSGYQGTLPDADATYVHGCFRSDRMQEFDDAGRTYRIMLEFEVQYAEIQ